MFMFVIAYSGDGFSKEFGYQIEIRKMKLNNEGRKIKNEQSNINGKINKRCRSKIYSNK